MWVRFNVGIKLSGDPSYFWVNPIHAICVKQVLLYMSCLTEEELVNSHGIDRPRTRIASRVNDSRCWTLVSARSAMAGCALGVGIVAGEGWSTDGGWRRRGLQLTSSGVYINDWRVGVWGGLSATAVGVGVSSLMEVIGVTGRCSSKKGWGTKRGWSAKRRWARNLSLSTVMI